MLRAALVENCAGGDASRWPPAKKERGVGLMRLRTRGAWVEAVVAGRGPRLSSSGVKGGMAAVVVVVVVVKVRSAAARDCLRMGLAAAVNM